MQTKPIDRRRKAVEEQIFYNFMSLVRDVPQYKIAQHLAHVLRRKGDSEDPYFWENEKLLKKFEDYKDELDREFKTLSPEEGE